MSKVTIYSPPLSAQIKHCAVDFDLRREPVPVHLVQYDKTLPILEVSLYKGGAPYRLPEDAEANVRMGKFNNRVIYNPVLGCGENRDKVYIAVTQQMTTQEGDFYPIVEVLVDGGVAGTSSMRLVVHRNPAQEDAIEDSSEAKSLDELVKQAAASAESARNDAEIAKQAERTVEANAGNIQAVVDNLDAIKAAPGQAQAAAESAAAAQKAAQEALGFRTFFSAIAPDANGGLDPSRPMTTPSTQASWTIESKGDRIQSVQANGFTSDGKRGGFALTKLVVDSATAAYFSKIGPATAYQYKPAITPKPISPAYLATIFCSVIETNTGSAVYQGAKGIAVNDGSYISISFGGMSPSEYVNTFGPFTIWYVPADESQATGLYIPIQAQGHEYRCQCLPLTEQLSQGDTVQSNVPIGCDKKIVFDASNLQGWIQDVTDDPEKYRYIYKLPDALAADASKEYKRNAYSDTFKVLIGGRTYYLEKGFTINAQNKNLYVYDEGESLSEWKEKVSSNPFTLFYKSVDYAGNDLPVSLETHASGAVYAHQAVELVAVPYTEADVTAANQLASTPSTLPYIEDSDVPMLLNESDATQTTESVAPLASALPVAGTYVVSSQDGTTVQVSLKAMQDGGDAATLGGFTLDDIKELISNAVTAAVRMAQAQGGNS